MHEDTQKLLTWFGSLVVAAGLLWVATFQIPHWTADSHAAETADHVTASADETGPDDAAEHGGETTETEASAETMAEESTDATSGDEAAAATGGGDDHGGEHHDMTGLYQAMVAFLSIAATVSALMCGLMLAFTLTKWERERGAAAEAHGHH